MKSFAEVDPEVYRAACPHLPHQWHATSTTPTELEDAGLYMWRQKFHLQDLSTGEIHEFSATARAAVELLWALAEACWEDGDSPLPPLPPAEAPRGEAEPLSEEDFQSFLGWQLWQAASWGLDGEPPELLLAWAGAGTLGGVPREDLEEGERYLQRLQEALYRQHLELDGDAEARAEWLEREAATHRAVAEEYEGEAERLRGRLDAEWEARELWPPRLFLQGEAARREAERPGE